MIVNKLAEIFTQAIDTELSPEELPREGIVEALQLNSVDALQILINVENAFGIDIDDDDLNSDLINSLYALENYIQKKLNQSNNREDE